YSVDERAAALWPLPAPSHRRERDRHSFSISLPSSVRLVRSASCLSAAFWDLVRPKRRRLASASLSRSRRALSLRARRRLTISAIVHLACGITAEVYAVPGADTLLLV